MDCTRLKVPRASQKDPAAQSELVTMLISMGENLPGVVIRRKLNAANFSVGKVLAFTKKDEVALKRPPAQVSELVGTDAASLLSRESAR